MFGTRRITLLTLRCMHRDVMHAGRQRPTGPTTHMIISHLRRKMAFLDNVWLGIIRLIRLIKNRLDWISQDVVCVYKSDLTETEVYQFVCNVVMLFEMRT